MHRFSRGQSLHLSHSRLPSRLCNRATVALHPQPTRNFWNQATTAATTTATHHLRPNLHNLGTTWAQIMHRFRIMYPQIAQESRLMNEVFLPSLSQLLANSKVPRGFGPYFEGGDSKPPKPSAKPQSPSPKKEQEETSKSDDSSSSQQPTATSSSEESSSSTSSSSTKGPTAASSQSPSSDEKKEEESKDGGSGGGGDDDEKKGRRFFDDPFMLWLLAPLALLLFGPNVTMKTNENEVSFQQFRLHMLEQAVVDHIEVVNKQTARIYLRNDMDDDAQTYSLDTSGKPRSKYGKYQPGKVYSLEIGSVDSFEDRLEQAQFDMGIDPNDYVPVEYISEINLRTTFTEMVTSGSFWMILLALYLWRSMRRTAAGLFDGLPGAPGGKGGGRFGGLFDVAKSNPKVLNKGEKVKTRFKDVAGLENAKEEVQEFVQFLKDPETYQKLGARTPKGCLLTGPPGTGKTLLARAVAGEADCTFYSISGSDFVEMFVGVGPSRVRDLFETARKNTPCIIFIDEIDAVGRKRGKGGWAGGNDERENTLNQLLVEMDGFKTDTNIVVMAATNRSDILDSALTRPGRFDRTIEIGKADIKGRIEIFKVHLEKLTLSEPIADVAQRMATLTPGFSGADIANVVNEGALRAARKRKDSVAMADFYEAVDRVIGGLEKKQVMTPQEKKLIAFHEAGHAVCGWFLEHADPLLKVTIIPRSSGALGFAQYLPKELQLYTKDQLMDMICMTLGGRASELIFFGRVSTGAADDLNKVTKLAVGLVQIYGMNDKMGNLSFPPDQYSDQPYRPMSEKTAQLIDAEAREIVEKAYVRAQELLTEKKEYVERLGNYLLENETIEHDALVEVLGHRPFQNDAYRQYLENTKDFAEKYGQEESEESQAEASSEEAKSATEENSESSETSETSEKKE